MTARFYSSPAQPEEDFVFPEGEVTLKVKVRCRCGVNRVYGFQMAKAALPLLRRANVSPDLVVASAWCQVCKTVVKVTAKALHLA